MKMKNPFTNNKNNSSDITKTNRVAIESETTATICVETTQQQFFFKAQKQQQYYKINMLFVRLCVWFCW